jgi:tripartite-type tricarboxylate transporter receptor subunit TctC
VWPNADGRARHEDDGGGLQGQRTGGDGSAGRPGRSYLRPDTNTTSHVKSGKIKPFAVTTKERLPSLPDLPTLDEASLKGFEVTIWHALYAPKGTPREVLDKLVAALQAVLKDPKVAERFADLGPEPVPQERATPMALKQHLGAEIAKWKPVIQATSIYTD